MNPNQLLLIDLSALAHQIWHISGNEPDPSFVSTQLVARVRALASQHPHAAICCDSGKSFRADLDPSYKAQRDTENRAPLRHQMDVACEVLRKDGFPVWKVKGFEADDLIATSTRMATEMDGDVLIASADKDLLQLVTDRVTFCSTSPNTDGKVFGPTQVVEKFGVRPEQFGDFLALVGDASDNIKGASGIGPKTAAELLSKFGDLSSVFKAIFAAIPYEEAKGIYSAYANAGDAGWKKIRKDLESRVPVTPSVFLSLVEFFPRHPIVASLIKLRSDVPEGDGFTFAEIATERVAAPMVEEAEMDKPVTEAEAKEYNDRSFPAAVPFERGNDANDKPLPFNDATTGDRPPFTAPTQAAPMPDQRPAQPPNPSQRIPPTAVNVAPVTPRQPVADFSLQLEPQNIDEAKTIARILFASTCFSQFPNEQAVFSVLMAGRAEGLKALPSMRAFHPTQKLPMDAAMIRGKVLESGKAKYFRIVDRTPLVATFETQRGDDPPVTLSYTIEEARAAFQAPKYAKTADEIEKAWQASNYGRNPADMLVARSGAKLARLVYPDVCAGLYAREEME